MLVRKGIAKGIFLGWILSILAKIRQLRYSIYAYLTFPKLNLSVEQSFVEMHVCTSSTHKIDNYNKHLATNLISRCGKAALHVDMDYHRSAGKQSTSTSVKCSSQGTMIKFTTLNHEGMSSRFDERAEISTSIPRRITCAKTRSITPWVTWKTTNMPRDLSTWKLVQKLGKYGIIDLGYRLDLLHIRICWNQFPSSLLEVVILILKNLIMFH